MLPFRNVLLILAFALPLNNLSNYGWWGYVGGLLITLPIALVVIFVASKLHRRQRP